MTDTAGKSELPADSFSRECAGSVALPGGRDDDAQSVADQRMTAEEHGDRCVGRGGGELREPWCPHARGIAEV